jgi:hypothetical protein
VEPFSELFDTNILIDHLGGGAKATREIRRSHDPAISGIKWIEMMTGAASPSEEASAGVSLEFSVSRDDARGGGARGGESAAEENQDAGCDYFGDGGGCGAAVCDTEWEGFSGGDSWG